MKTRRYFSLLVAILLILAILPIGQAQAESDWLSGFQSFVLNQEYLQVGLNFNSDAYIQPRFSLYDFDKDGVPELFAFNGGPSLAQSTVYVFKHESWGISYVGNVGFRGCELYYYGDSAYPGVFCSDGNNGVIRTVYYELQSGNLTSSEIGSANTSSTPNYLPFYINLMISWLMAGKLLSKHN